MDFLKRELAPVTAEAWAAMDERAKETLRLVMAARRVVDVKGPLGWETQAVALGTLGKTHKSGGVAFGTRQVLPLVELRIPFTMKTWELDNITRGDLFTDWKPLDTAARELARFEDETVFLGRTAASMKGLIESSENEPVTFDTDSACTLMDALALGIRVLSNNAVGGKFALLCNSDLWQFIVTTMDQSRPLRKRIEKDLGIKIVRSQQVDLCALISLRGGDFELTLGQDVAIGYQNHTAHEVTLFFTESFAFRVIGPEAVVPLVRRS